METLSRSTFQDHFIPVSSGGPLHELRYVVQIFDTDCYGVMWHGAYAKWLEMGRVALCQGLRIAMALPGDPEGYVFPVIEQNLRYRSRAALNETLILATRVAIDGHKLVFSQQSYNETTGKVTLEAVTTVVVVDTTWHPQRKIPPEISEKLAG